MLSGPASASGSHAGNCVAYVRDVTGIRVSGNAGLWWNHAEGRYRRGHEPVVGAVLVFKPYGRMHSGHVAVVSRLLSKREILVDHANWVRGRVVKAMSVIDTSPKNDWTMVEVLAAHAQSHGRDNPTFGFIYPERAAPQDAAILVGYMPDEGPLDDAPRAYRHHHHARHAARHHEGHDRADTIQVSAFDN